MVDLKARNTITVGNSIAPHQLTIVMNLSCRYCKKFWQRNKANIMNALESDDLQLHIKFFVKNKEPLKIGNIASQYIDFDRPDESFDFISSLIRAQNQFKRYLPETASKYLEEQYGVEKHNSVEELKNTTNELKKSGVRGIPTIILDGKWHDSFKYRLPELN